MATTDAPETFIEMVVDLQNKVHSQTGITATQDIAKRMINTGLRDMHIRNGDMFPWAEASADLQLRAPYSTGLCTIAQGSITLTGVADSSSVSPSWNTADAFGTTNVRARGKIVINGGTDVYEVASVASDTSLTLTNNWISTTIDGTTQTDNGGTYEYFEDVYDLDSAFLRPLDVRQFSKAIPIELVGRTEFRRRFIRNRITGEPRTAMILHRDTTSSAELQPTITFHPPPSAVHLIPYSFVTQNLAMSASGTRQRNLSADTDEPIVPVQYRQLIILHALWHWYERSDDARAQMAAAEYLTMLDRVAQDNEIGSGKPHIAPRVSHYARRARSPWGGSGRRRYDVNGEFDRLEDRR